MITSLSAFSIDSDELEDLVSDLNATEYSVRETAKEKLIKKGKEAIPYLEKAAKSEDVELAENAKEIIKIINKISGCKDAPECGKADLTRNREFSEWMDVEIPELLELEDEEQQNAFSMSLVTVKDGEEIRITSNNKEFSLTVKTEDETTSYTAKNKNEFKEKYPEVYEKYKSIIDSMKFQTVKPKTGVWRFDNKNFRGSLEDLLKNLTKREQNDEDDWTFDDELFGRSFEFDELMKKLEESMKRYMGKFHKHQDDEDSFEFETRPGVKPTTPKNKQKIEKNLGIELAILSEEDAKARDLGKNAIVISKIDKPSLLYKSGLREGDAILKINNEDVKSTLQIRKELINCLNAGGSIEINRDGNLESIEIEK
ncbi:MAG: PDZ domain-containing protein [Planctomycetes bacterium]|nr:PDZ domain-containing protein [Planctomycetota bacterium]